MKNNKVTDQQNLDELQVKWVLGKQRGEEVPLKKEELELLVKNGRVEVGWLGEEERKKLKNGVGLTTSKSAKLNLKKDNDTKLIKIENLVHMILKSVSEDVRKSYGKLWNDLSEVGKEEMARMHFFILYKKYPEKMLFDLYESLSRGVYAKHS